MADPKVKKHRHVFSALWWRLGIYGPQNLHVHSCVDDDCGRVVVGPGRDCDGYRISHHRETMGTDTMKWVAW